MGEPEDNFDILNLRSTNRTDHVQERGHAVVWEMTCRQSSTHTHPLSNVKCSFYFPYKNHSIRHHSSIRREMAENIFERFSFCLLLHVTQSVEILLSVETHKHCHMYTYIVAMNAYHGCFPSHCALGPTSIPSRFAC